MARKTAALKRPAEPLFEVQTQDAVRVSRAGGAVRAILKKVVMEKLGLEGNFLSAATVEVSPGRSVLLMGAAGVIEHLRVNKSGERGFEVVVDDGNETQVDAITQAFLTLKAAQFERDELDLSEPYSAEDVAALAADSFEEAQRLLKK